MNAVANMDQIVKMWAFEHYVYHWDGYSVVAGTHQPNNYFLHSDDQGAFTMIPSGMDQVLGTTVSRHDRGSVLTESFGRIGHSVLIRRCIANQQCKNAYVASLQEIKSIVDQANYSDYLATTAAAIRNHVVNDPKKEQSITEVDAAVARMTSWLAKRPSSLTSWLQNPTFTLDKLPSPPAPPVKPKPAPKPIIAIKRQSKLLGPRGNKRVIFKATSRHGSSRVVFFRSTKATAKAQRISVKTTNRNTHASLRVRLRHNKRTSYTQFFCVRQGDFVTGAIRVTYRPVKGYKVAISKRPLQKIAKGVPVRCRF